MKFVECFGYPRYWIDLISFAKQTANKSRGKFLEKNTKRKKPKLMSINSYKKIEPDNSHYTVAGRISLELVL